jgi:hypothetical protein
MTDGLRELIQCSDLLQAGRSRDRIPVGARFSAPGHGAHPATCKMGTGSFSPEVKLPDHGVDHSPLSGVRLKKE